MSALKRLENRHIFMDMGNQNHKHPHEVFYELLWERFKKPVIRCKSVQIKATLLLDNFSVWREVVVPLRFTFAALHNIVQRLFSRADSQLNRLLMFGCPRKNAQALFYGAWAFSSSQGSLETKLSTDLLDRFEFTCFSLHPYEPPPLAGFLLGRVQGRRYGLLIGPMPIVPPLCMMAILVFGQGR